MHPRHTLSIVTLALLAACPAIAVQNSDDETIVVTATRFPDSRFGAPIGARVITDDEIRYSGAANVAEVLNKLGGVQTRRDLYGGSNPGLDLRGFGAAGDQNTLVLVDGVRVSKNELAAARLSGISLDSVERIEILPGGGGAVLYGSNATGGVINIITKPGRFDSREANVSVGTGNFGTRDLRASANVGGERISLNLNAQDYQSDNERKNNRVEQKNADGRLAFRLQDTDLALNFGSERNRSQLPGARTETQWHDDPRGTSTPNDFAHTDLWHAGLSLTHRMGDVEFAANLARRDRSTEYLFNDIAFGILSTDQRHVTMDEFSPRVKWKTDLAGLANELIAGYDVRNWDFESKKHDDFGFGFAGPSLETGKQKTEAWYLQDRLQVSSSTLLSFGARTESLDIRRNVPYALTMTPTNQEDKRRVEAWSLGLKQTFVKGLAAHVRTGTSYRIANIDENRCYGATCDLLKPQTSKDHELGLAWNGKDVLASIVLFRSNLNNEIYYNNLLFTNVNLTPTRREGMELAGTWDPLPNLTLNGRYTFTDATFRSGVYSGIDVSGKTVPVVPRHRASLIANWAITGIDRFNLGVNYVGRQQYDNDPANRFAKMPSYTTVDTKYSHRIGDATLGLTVKNLFDKKYYSYALVNSSTSPTTFNAYADLSRTIMATFDYTFR